MTQVTQEEREAFRRLLAEIAKAKGWPTLSPLYAKLLAEREEAR